MNFIDKFGWETPSEVLRGEEELGVLGEHLVLIEQLIEQRQKELEREWTPRLANAEITFDFEVAAEYEFEQSIAPRALRNSFLVSLYSVYESITADIAKHIRKSKGRTLHLKDIKLGIPNRTKKYYDDVIGFQLLIENENLKKLEELRKLRNFFAHSNAYLYDLSKQERKAILRIGDGVEGIEGYVVVSKDFLSDMFLLVNSVLRELMERFADWKITERRSLSQMTKEPHA